MLRKVPIITVIPPVEGQAYRAASYTCYTYPPTGTGGDTNPPDPPPPPATGVVPPVGTPIILEDANLDPPGSYTVYTGLAPAPDGFVCREQVTWVTNYSDPSHPTTIYYYVCTRN